MTFSPKVWGDALRRLQDEIPDFAFDAWIAPLTVKVAGDHLLLGCPSLFHRDRIRKQYAGAIQTCWQTARSHAGVEKAGPDTIEILTLKEFDAASGRTIKTQLPVRRETETGTPMRRVGVDSASERTPVAVATAQGMAQDGTPDSSQDNAGGRVRPGGDGPHCGSAQEPMLALDHALRFEKADGTPASEPALRAVPERKRPARTTTRSNSVSRKSFGDESASEPAQAELPFSFESFIVGPCNALAREAALALARRRQRSLNQVYLGGESGMGKTHLARATATEARRFAREDAPLAPQARRINTSRASSTSPSAFNNASNASRTSRVVYTSAEQFTSEFVSAMRLGRSEEWKRRYRGPIGMLIVEDVQFFSGRAKTQLELFHTVQHVLDAGGSVLLTGDRAPRDLVGLDERMRDQVGRGFVAELEMPDALVRRHILRSKAAAGGVHLPDDCLNLLVESSAGSVRDIESVLIQVVTTSSLLGRTIDLDLTQEAISLKSGAGSSLPAKTIATAEIVRIVAAFFGKRPEALAGRSRRRDVLIPRQLAMYLAHRYTNASFTEIGRELGRDHPAVRNAISRIERLILENAPLRYQIESLSERIDQSLKRSDSTSD